MIVANIGVLLIGLGGSKIFKDYAVNVMRYILAVAIKLFVLQLVVNIGFAIISLSDLDASVGSTVKSIKFVDLFFLIGKAVILLALAKSLPDTCAGIINGSAIGGGNPIAGMAKTAGVMAVGAVSAGAGYAVGAAKATNAAHTIAQENGATGVVGTMAGMARAAWQARGDAKAGEVAKALESNPGSMKNQLLSSANAAKAMRLLDDVGEQEAPPTSSAGGSGTAAPTSVSVGNSTGNSEAGTTPPVSTGGAAQPVLTSNNTTGSGASEGENTQAAPAANNAGGSGAAVPTSTSAEGSGAIVPEPSESGSNTPPPESNPGGSGQAVPSKPSKDDYGPPQSSKGTVDMRTFDPSTLKK